MPSGDPVLIDEIRAAIRVRGPVTFAWFMEQALYHPTAGYYSSGRCSIGRRGDYFTNVSVGPLFGRLMAAQFAELWETMGRPAEFTIVEQGAHGGEFARDVLTALREEHCELFEAVRYEIIEPFPVLKERQLAELSQFAGKVSWRDSLDALPPFRGVHFSNELLDAMPVHLVRWTGEEWLERHVTDTDGEFAFVDLPLSNPELTARLAKVTTPLPAGYLTEVNLAAGEWIEAVARKLVDGAVIAVDYGWPRDEFYAPHRATGTLRGYAQHRVTESPLEQIGQADITAHVEWTSLAKDAQECGLKVLGFTDQHHFITGLLAGPLRECLGSGLDAQTARQLQTLLHPNHLGMKFQFLVLAKNIPASANLAGLKFARDPQRALFAPSD